MRVQARLLRTFAGQQMHSRLCGNNVRVLALFARAVGPSPQPSSRREKGAVTAL